MESLNMNAGGMGPQSGMMNAVMNNQSPVGGMGPGGGGESKEGGKKAVHVKVSSSFVRTLNILILFDIFRHARLRTTVFS